MKLVCVRCEVELKPETNGVIVAEMFRGDEQIYKLWEADLWKCPLCENEIVAGFAKSNFAEHYKDNCEEIVRKAIASGRKVIYDTEYVGLGGGHPFERKD